MKTNPADKIEQWELERLTPYARNSRTHSDAQVAQLAASIREWGWTTPVLVSPDGGIIAGHGRVLAARQLGMVNVPVQLVGAGSFLFRVGKHSGAFEAELLDEFQQFLEILLGFAGESYDERSTNAEAGNSCTHATKQVADVIAGGDALHRGKHPV